MLKSIVRKSLVKKGPAALEIRGAETVPNSPYLRAGNFYNVLLAKKGKGKACVIRRLGGIGDVLMCTPALRQLKADFPELELTFAIDMHSTSGNIYYELMKNAPFVNHLIDARFVKDQDYDAVVDISSVCIKHEHSGLPLLNRIDIFARACGIPNLVNKKSWYSVTNAEFTWAQKILEPLRKDGKKIVVLHTASMEGKRCWPREKYFQLVEQGLQDNLSVCFVLLDFNHVFDKWEQYSNCYNASNTTLRQMAALIAASDFFIGPDSGPMHLAGAIGIPSVITFGSIPPEARINYYPTHEGVRVDTLACIGCWYRPCPYDTKCMKELDYKIVYNKMRKRINV